MSPSLEQFAELARKLHAEPSAKQTLEHIVASACELIEPCDHAGVSFARRRGEVVTAMTSSDLPQRSNEIQLALGEGPCMEAAWDYSVVHVRDLSSEHRWVKWASQAQEELGVGSVLCVQLFTHRDRLGVLSLYSSKRHAFDEGDEEAAFAIAAQASVALASAEEVEQLGESVNSRTVIGQAIGLVMCQYHLTSEQAFGVLRELSMDQNRKVALLARELVNDWDAEGHKSASPGAAS